jgi:hypothetical protein
MSWKNEIADELYQVKDAYAAKFDYDLGRMVEDLQQKEVIEKRKGRRFVSFPARRCRTEFPFAPIDSESAISPPRIDVLPWTADNPTSSQT